MKALILGAVLAALAVPAAAQPQGGQLGLGLLLGDPTSGSAKYWLDKDQAIDFGIGVSHTLVMHADYMYHGWDLIPEPKRGKLSVYGALGPRLEFYDDVDFGIRAVPGLSYWPTLKRPVEMFVELGPVFRLTNGLRVRIDGGFGVRWYFTPRAAK